MEPDEGEGKSKWRNRLAARKFGQASRGDQHGKTLHVKIDGATFECIKVTEKESALFVKVCSRDDVYVKTQPSDSIHAVLTFLASNISADDLKK